MRKVLNILLFLLIVFFVNKSVLVAMPIGQAAKIVADRLENKQIKEGVYAGSWPGEIEFTGSIVAGLIRAYEINCDTFYKTAAELGGNAVIFISQGNLYGDEAFALTCLSMNSSDPNNNLWRDTVSNFYENLRYLPGGTESYMQNFYTIDPSVAVLYMSNHVLAAYYVDAVDKEIWRTELINLLSHVDDSSAYSVMALGAALWALSQTDLLDDTAISSYLDNNANSYWENKKLEDLPDFLMSHQAQDNEPNAGSFYWQFGHTLNSSNNYTEDAIFATLGLTAAYKLNQDPNLHQAICNARTALLEGIDIEGKVWEELSKEGVEYSVYAGEMLLVLKELILSGDINLDCDIDLVDFEMFYENWERSDCTQENCWCDTSDFDHNGIIDIYDFYIFMEYWIQEINFQDP